MTVQLKLPFASALKLDARLTGQTVSPSWAAAMKAHPAPVTENAMNLLCAEFARLASLATNYAISHVAWIKDAGGEPSPVFGITFETPIHLAVFELSHDVRSVDL